MSSIAQTGPRRQLGKSKIKVYPFGIHIDSPLNGQKSGTGGGGPDHRRKEITGFSTAARRRMREALLTNYIEESHLVGATFTVPWKGSDFEPLMDEFRECWHRFGVAFRRAFPKSAMIYRVELQERGAPHVHAMIWLHTTDVTAGMDAPVAPVPAAAAVGIANYRLADMWRKAVPDLHFGSYAAFEKFGVKVEAIPDTGAMFRYMADHASKKKQAQLGYKGKQWGIVGQSNMQKRQSVDLPRFRSHRHKVIFMRLLRKVMRYRLQASRHHWKRRPPFGSVLKGSLRQFGDFYVRQETISRMWEHALDLARSR